MYLKNEREIDRADFGENLWEVEVHSSAGNTDAEIIDFVRPGAWIEDRDRGYAVVRFYA